MNQLQLLQPEEKNPLDLAYIAGLFDGEGSVSINKVSRCYSVQTSIEMVDYKAPQKCKDIFGGKIYIHKQRVPYQSHADWRLTGQSAIHFLRIIQPFLLTKADSVRIVLEFYEQYWLPGRNRVTLRRQTLGQEYKTKLSNYQSRKLKPKI